ncbi:MAG: ATP-binding protein, partial [Ginsengibacter sp.]
TLDASEKIFGDRNRLGQVMTNILSNAIKYSPRADHIIVTTTHKNNHIKFCVRDFGIGIPKENQPHVFDQFFRVSGEVEDTFGGLGLGLFIASEIIRRSKGTMSVQSEIGKGSTFCFSLPLKK